MRVEEGEGLAGAIGNLVMVDDDDVHAHLVAEADAVVIAGATVARDDERTARGGEIMGIGLAKAVTVSATCHTGRNRPTGAVQEVGQQRTGGHPVDVVVAKDADGLAINDGSLDALDRGGKARHGERSLGGAKIGQAWL